MSTPARGLWLGALLGTLAVAVVALIEGTPRPLLGAAIALAAIGWLHGCVLVWRRFL